MSIQITSWIRAFFALQDCVGDLHGYAEINPGTPEVERWPRTTGADIITIAAVVDPLAQAHEEYGTARRWNAAVADIERLALPSPLDEYAENRAFWRALASTFVDFHATGVPLLEAERWGALFEQLGNFAQLRNAGPSGDVPFGPFEGVKSWGDLYRAQVKYLLDKRGFDKMQAPPGYTFGGNDMMIPRATNADVLRMTAFWSQAFANAKRISGREGVEKEWAIVMADVDKLAKPGKPDDRYAKNNELWRKFPNVATQVQVADETPTSWDMMLDSIKDSIAHLPDRLSAGAKKLADLAGDAAHGIGGIANEAGKGLFQGFGTPLLIGAGLIGLFLVARARRGDHEEE